MTQSAQNSPQSSRVAGVEILAGGIPVLEGRHLRKIYGAGEKSLTVLADASIALHAGEMVAIVAPSGAGKSTLLHLLAALDTPTSGAIYFDAKAIESNEEAALAEFRNCAVGFLWQRHQLLPDFTAAENVAMPSGGQRQRVAIARALVTGPRVLLADEPTGDLDEQNAWAVFELLERLHRAHRLTSLIATHNLALAARCDRIVGLEHGVLKTRGAQASATGTLGGEAS